MFLSHRFTLKNLFSFLLAIVFALTLTACGGGGGGGSNNTGNTDCVLGAGTLDNCTLQ